MQEQYKVGLNIQDVLKGLSQIDRSNEKVWRKAEKDANAAIKSIISGHNRLLKLTQQLDRSITNEAKALQRAAKEAEKLAKAGQGGGKAGIKDIGDSAQLSGVQIGAVSGLVSELTHRIINLGEQAVSAFIGMTQEAINMASGLETTENIFTGILGGNEDAAIAALQHIRKENRQLGIDLSETTRAFLPFVSSLKELDRVNRISAALAISQPEQGELGARIALQEALSGNVQSLVRRFEIPKTLGKELQKALDEGGVEAFLTTFEGIMKRMGRDVDNLTDTFQFAFGRATQNLSQLQTAFGVPITDELKQQLNDLNAVFEANFDDFEGLATLAGQTVSELFSGLDASGVAQFFADNKQDIAEFLTAIQQVVKSAKELLDLDLGAGFNVDTLTTATLKINQIVDALTAIKTITASIPTGDVFFGGLEGSLNGLFPVIGAAIALWNNLDLVVQGVIHTYGLFIATASATSQAVSNSLSFGNSEDLVDPQKVFNDVMEKTNKALEDYKKNTKEAADAVDNAVVPTKANTEANEALTDSILALNNATAALADLEEEYADAQAKVAEDTEKAALDHQRKLEDIDIDFERRRLDNQIEFAQKREDAATDNLRKIADLREKYSQDVSDAQLDLERKEDEIARKFGDQRIDQERERRQKRLDIERDFRIKLQDIQREFLISAGEAEEKRDAVAFVRALKERDQKVQNAQIDRTREIQELRISNQQKTEELRLQQQRELESARIANEQKLEDLRTNLNRQIEEQNENYQEQLDDISTSETRKAEELARWREREIEDAKLAYDRKRADLEAALDEELKIIEEYAAKRAELQAQIDANQAAIDANQPRPSTTGGASAGFGLNPSTLSTSAPPKPKPHIQLGFSSIRKPKVRDTGGSVDAYSPYIVGLNKKPELFVPEKSGRVYNQQQLQRMNIPFMGGGSNTTNNTKQINLSVPADRLTPGQRSEARMIALEVLDGVN